MEEFLVCVLEFFIFYFKRAFSNITLGFSNSLNSIYLSIYGLNNAISAVRKPLNIGAAK